MRPLLLVAVALAGCNGGTVQPFDFSRAALVLGDFDRLEDIVGDELSSTPPDLFDGYIDGARVETDDAIAPGDLTGEVEDLLRSDPAAGLLDYDTVLLPDGVRGCNQLVYNGVAEDDHLVRDATVIDHLRVAGQRVDLYVADWTYDLVEAAWPELVDWVGDDAEIDAAQQGANQTVLASIVDPVLADRLAVPVGTEVEITYDFDTWAVPEAVDLDRAEVLVQGEAVVEDPLTGAPTSRDVPLMLRADLDGGHLLFSTFHQSAQTGLAADLLVAGLADLHR